MAITYPRPFPTVTGARQVLFRARSAVSITQSPFSFAQEVQAHPGKIWGAEVEFPIMERATADQIESWLISLNGSEHTFFMGPPAHEAPRGSWAGTPLVNGAAQTGNELAIDGLTEGGTIRTGDYFQLGVASAARLYRHVGDDIVAGVPGTATLDTWPDLRVSPNDNDPVIFSAPVGLWRLAQNTVEWITDEARIVSGVTFRAIEAL